MGSSGTTIGPPFLGGGASGVQIGSNKEPPSAPWSISCSFPEEITILSFEVTLTCNATGTWNVRLGEESFEEQFTNQNQTAGFGREGLSIPTDSFRLSFSCPSKAVYLYGIAFLAEVPADSGIHLTTDAGDVVPSVPGEGLIPETNYPETTPEEYYEGIDWSNDGEALEEDLRALVSDMTRIGYQDATNIMRYTDQDPDNPGYMYGAWDGDLIRRRRTAPGTRSTSGPART